MIRNLINYFCFLLGWYALIEYGNVAAPFVAIYIVCHILAQKTKTRELITLLIVSIIGIANDIFLIHIQVIKFYPKHIFPPFWFITLWPLFASISGAKYSAVPQKLSANLSLSNFVAKPKSASSKYPSLLNSTFSGFRSLYMIY